jgi:hypothetical protein
MKILASIASIATILATLMYIITTYLFLYDPIGRSDEPNTHLYNFFMWYTIPIILWVIYFIMNEIKKTNIKIPSFTNSNLKENTNIYHIQENGATSEPITYNQLQAKNITKDTYVWRKGLDWTKAGELRELNQLFEQNSPPPFVEPKPDLDFIDKYTNEIIFILILVGVAIFIFIGIRIYQHQSTSVALKPASNIAVMIV